MKAFRWWLLWLWLGVGLLSGGGWLVANGAGAPPAAVAAAPLLPAAPPVQGTATPTPACSAGWSIVPSANQPGTAVLNAVAALGPNDVWAVGYSIDTLGTQHTLTAHWNGALWSLVPSSAAGPGPVQLKGVRGVAANDVWAVGTSGQHYRVTLHWNGTQWSEIANPNPGFNYYNALQGVYAVAADDVWALGGFRQSSWAGLFLHWNGAAWQTTALVGYYDFAAANDAWAVGAGGILHYDGTAWAIWSQALTNLSGVAAIAADDVWAVATSRMLLHWNGSAWSQVPVLNVGTLKGVAAVNSSNLWAVGAVGAQTLVEHYASICTTATATPTSTATATPTPMWTPTQTPTPTPTVCGPAWQLVSSPPAGTYPTLRSVSASGPSDVWAVGSHRFGQNTNHTLTEHWDGTAWTIVPSPNVGAGTSDLYGVAAISPADAWAVGSSRDTTGPYQTLIEHWDGSAWTVVPSPNPGVIESGLNGVSALAANDVWAVGVYFDTGYDRTLVLHWDGQAWTQVPSPNVVGWRNSLNAVAARTTTDIWAVGDAGAVPNTYVTLTEHWDGSAWTIVPGPDPGPPENFLAGVAVLAANDAWAVGASATGTAEGPLLLEHWNGSAWTLVPGPPVAGGLRGVAATAANDVWAAGSYFPGTNDQTLLAHWDGSAWTQVPSPNPGYGNNYLAGVTMLGAADGWAAGAGSPGPPILHYRPACGTPGPTATPAASATPAPTTTPGGLSVTPQPPSATNTPGGPSPTSCTVDFADVQPTDYFYTPVRYLSCRGVISGYADGTFRPYNTTTRGQMVKIVVGGFNKPIRTPAGGAATFEDAPPASPFFPYIETAAAGGIVSGYSCGHAPAGPCVPPLNRPYFLPTTNVTRGQIAKIAAVAAGWMLLTPPTRTFEDVLPSTAFYPFVETTAARGVVSGYTCGAPPAGPCVPPAHRPYFLQGNPATRGQIAKIVYLAILSGPAFPPR